jgi:hypothetical protein
MNNRKFTSGALMADAVSGIQWQLEALQAQGERIDELVSNFPDGCVSYVSAYTTSLTINIKGDSSVLTEVIRFMRTNGWYCEGERPKANEPRWEGTFKHRDLVRQPVNITFGSTVCRRVQVGTKVVVKEVEEPIYETQCDEPIPEHAPDRADSGVASDPMPANSEDDHGSAEREASTES